MDRNELKQTLESLHTELNAATTVDDETRAMLAALADDIHRLADQESSSSPDQLGPISARLQDLVLQFDADHPQLSRALNQVSAALANLGI